jgi:cytochrome P450
METTEPDVASHFIAEAEKNPDDPHRDNWLQGDATTLLIAGSDTTAPTLTFLLYCLAQHPENQQKLFDELSSVDILDISTLATLPHLNGCIDESMRLYPVAATSISRQTPPQGVNIGSTYIPGDVIVVAPRWVIFRRKFPRFSTELSSANVT